MHLLLSLVVAVDAPQTPETDTLAQEVEEALGEDPLETPTDSRPQHVDFTDPAEVFGTLDDVIDIAIEPTPNPHLPLFQLRQDFTPELEQSVHFIR